MGKEGGAGDPTARKWLQERTELAVVAAEPAFDRLATAGVTKVGCLGFCWGAYVTFKLSSKIAAGVCCHPSLGVYRWVNPATLETQEDLCKAVQCPIMFLPAGNDADCYRDGTYANLIPFECTHEDYPEMKHGWVPRGDESDPSVKRDVEKAITSAAAFFDKHL